MTPQANTLELDETTLNLAAAFLAEDPDEDSRAALQALITKAKAGDDDAIFELKESFLGTLSFGTAGLRGKVAPGTNRMNRVQVMKASWGLGTYLIEEGARADFDAKKRGVIIGFDGRRSSRQFAEDTAAVLCGLGLTVRFFDARVPTPVCAFAVEHLHAAAGVMVTASHNPPQDNGYKVYWNNAAQIIPPHDAGIAACIARAPVVSEMKRVGVFDAMQNNLRETLGEDLFTAYFTAIDAYRSTSRGDVAPIRVVYTAMHGVGHPFVMHALSDAGVFGVASVSSQADPDGAFPTVSFPNPEEPGAMDRALATAAETNAHLVIANDPDADRLAVAVRHEGGYRMLSGNQIGTLLGADALDNDVNSGAEGKGLVITTLVSSTMLSRMAKNYGASYAETLTGFKWIANTAMDLAQSHGERFLFGFEEALGYSVGPLVRDKDGVSAAVHLVEIAAELLAQGKTLLDRLDALEVRHGLSAGDQWSVVIPGSKGKKIIAAAMEALRTTSPTELDGSAVVETTDLLKGVTTTKDGERAATMPASNVLVYTSDDGTRLTVRPSGTEPKIKMYLEATAQVSNVDELSGARTKLKERLARVRQEVDARLNLPA